MGNILLTNYCNRRCRYCFAQDRIAPAKNSAGENAKKHISRENFDQALQFLKRSSSSSVGLLGGEPTLHPEFPELVDRALADGFRIKLFSNGMMPPSALDRLSRIEPERLLTIVNVNHPDETPAAERKWVAATLDRLGKRAALGFNIYRDDFDAEFLVDMVQRHGLDTNLRIGLAQPIFGGHNAFVARENYRLVGKRLVRFSQTTGRHGLALGLDCGFTLCMFEPADIGPLIYNGVTFKMLCNPIIDISVDLTVWCCFPLSTWEPRRLDEFENRHQLVSFYEKKLQPFRAIGATSACFECRHKAAGNCRSGCVSHSIAAFYEEKPAR